MLVPSNVCRALACLLAPLTLAAVPEAANATNWVANNDADLAALLGPSLVRPGDTIQLHGHTATTTGIYTQPRVLTSANSSLTITAYPGETPVLQYSLFLSGAENVTISGLTFTQCPQQWGGIVLQGGAANNVIQNNDISACGPGVFVWGDGGGSNNPPTGPNNSIISNTIHDNNGDGIQIGLGTATLVNMTIRGNTIYNNGGDGIVTSANNATIEYNTVYHNGQVIAGTSGIRVGGFNGNLPSGYGQNNIIRYNVVYGQGAHQAYADGNGIQLDTFSAYNYVYFNDIHDNDGFGISLNAAEGNWVVNNTIYQNGQCNFLPDLALGGSSQLAAPNPLPGGTPAQYAGYSIGNIIANNLISSAMTQPNPQPACTVDGTPNGTPLTPSLPWSIVMDIGSYGNSMGNQLIVPDQNGTIRAFIRDATGNPLTRYVTTVADWNAAKPTTEWPDLAADPRFLNPAAETATTGRSTNLSLQSTSPAYQAGLSLTTVPFLPACPSDVSKAVDLWQGFANLTANPIVCNVTLAQPPIGAYSVDP